METPKESTPLEKLVLNEIGRANREREVALKQLHNAKQSLKDAELVAEVAEQDLAYWRNAYDLSKQLPPYPKGAPDAR